MGSPPVTNPWRNDIISTIVDRPRQPTIRWMRMSPDQPIFIRQRPTVAIIASLVALTATTVLLSIALIVGEFYWPPAWHRYTDDDKSLGNRRDCAIFCALVFGIPLLHYTFHRRRRWRVSTDGVQVFRGSTLLRNIPWSSVVRIHAYRHRISLVTRSKTEAIYYIRRPDAEAV